MSNAPFPTIHPPTRILMGPGPSVMEPSVLNAMGRPTLGHLDPAFLQIMDELRVMLRLAFRTNNELTMPMSGTGSAGMETVLVNLIEPGDRVLVGICGVFGQRMAEVAFRAGAEVVKVEGEWGRALDPDALRKAGAGGSFKALCVVHGETSTGVLQPMEEMRGIADELGALLIMDCVTSLAGVPVEIDKWGVDAAYSGTQKCLSCPPGLSPITFSARAQEVLAKRKTKVASWYLDLTLIGSYWGQERVYHHTAPINGLYGLHEAVRVALEEGLETRWARHRAVSQHLYEGLTEMGLDLRVPGPERLAPLTAVAVPAGADDALVRGALLQNFDLEIGGGLGPMKGNTWRIGLMGAGATRAHVELCLAGLRSALA
jgi:alanine-glyoxylate transaminase / serine-glyoxylate transaminase / serine-pyruvate transaminase